jgi:hypothetical protein
MQPTIIAGKTFRPNGVSLSLQLEIEGTAIALRRAGPRLASELPGARRNRTRH